VIDGSHQILGTNDFQGRVAFLNDVNTWLPDINLIDGAQFVQMRVTFLSNIETGLSPVLSAIGVAYSQN